MARDNAYHVTKIPRPPTIIVQAHIMREMEDEMLASEELFYEEIDNGRKYFRCSICFRLLSRKQRIERLLQSVHGKGKRRFQFTMRVLL